MSSFDASHDPERNEDLPERPGDPLLQFPTRSRSSSNQFSTRMNRLPPPVSPLEPAGWIIRNRASSGSAAIRLPPSSSAKNNSLPLPVTH